MVSIDPEQLQLLIWTEPNLRDMLSRHTDRIEWHDDAEAAKLYHAICSGMFQHRRTGHLDTAIRIADATRPAAMRHDPEMVALWKEPDGY